MPRRGCAKQTSAVANCVTSTAAFSAQPSPRPILRLHLMSAFYVTAFLFSSYPPDPTDSPSYLVTEAIFVSLTPPLSLPIILLSASAIMWRVTAVFYGDP